MNHQEFLNKINELELKYKANGYNGVENSGSFIIRKSTKSIPVILSAPHTVKQFRDGRTKAEELFTGALVEALGEHFDLNCIIKTENVNDDANWDMDSPYKLELINFIQQNNIKILLDIHGASSKRPFDIELGTNDGININQKTKIIEIFKKIAGSYGINNITVDETFTASKINTVSRFIHDKTNIICIQLEINKKFRSPNEDMDNFLALFYTLNHFLYVASEYLQSEERFVDILPVKQTTLIEPTNRAELTQSQLDLYDLKHLQNLVISSATGEKKQALLHLKAESEKSGDYLYVTKRLFDDNFAEHPFALVQRPVKNKVAVLKPKIEAIVDNAVLVSEDIYTMYNDKQMEICNEANNAKITLPIIQYPHCDDKKKTIWLSSHQRQLVGLELPTQINEFDFTRLLSFLKNDVEKDTFNRVYCYNDENKSYELNETADKKDKNDASKWYRLRFATVHINYLEKNQEKFTERSLDKLIGAKKIALRVAKSPDLDDGTNIIRLSSNNIKMLGVEETDYVDVYYANKKVKLRVVEMDDVFKDIIIKDNKISDPTELELIACIPIRFRHQLDVNNAKNCVILQRDTKFIFFKNANIQMLTIFGLIMTVFQLPIESLTYKILLTVVLVPLTLLSAFSFERQKVAD